MYMYVYIYIYTHLLRGLVRFASCGCSDGTLLAPCRRFACRVLTTATCHLIMHRKPNGKLHYICVV